MPAGRPGRRVFRMQKRPRPYLGTFVIRNGTTPRSRPPASPARQAPLRRDTFGNAAAHLEPGGCFVIEVGIPDLRRLPPGQDTVPFQITPTRWAYDRYDVATQAMSSNYVKVEDGRGEYRSIPFRYVWPSELDLMAQMAGLRLRDRWDGWTGAPFTSESSQHVSVWEKPAR
jgi:hypothetical protein